MKNWQKWLLAIGGTILLIVVIPIAINEFYKADTVYYVSMWDAADALSYYGTVLGAVAAVTALVAAIAYYRKQIIYEKTLQREQDKWTKIEKRVDQALDDVHPSKISTAIAEALESQRIDLAYLKLSTYNMTARTSVDKLLFLMEKDRELTGLIKTIDVTVEKLSTIVTGYMNFLVEIYGKNTSGKALDAGMMYCMPLCE